MNHSSRGFTLIELLVSTAVLMIFLMFAFTSMQSMTTAAKAGTAAVDATAENQKVIQAVNMDALQSNMSRVTITPTTLTLQVIAGFDDVNGIELWSGFITYSRNAQNQVVRTQNGAAKVVANRVTALGFTLSVGDVTVSVTTVSGDGGNNTDSQVVNSLTIAPKN